jgi:hypothetical protein
MGITNKAISKKNFNIIIRTNHGQTEIVMAALSPDLSPIEHLWDELGRRVRHRQNPQKTLQKLRDALVHEWNNILQTFIQRLIGSMRRRWS